MINEFRVFSKDYKDNGSSYVNKQLASAIRALIEAAAPKGLTYTNFGPGMSMGHTVAVKEIDGVDFSTVSTLIKTDPYFVNDETIVIQVSDLGPISDRGHSTNIKRKGVSGSTHNQM